MLPNKPFFSVLMPTYNRAHLLPLAIKSVLQQTFEDFEIVISNGGSTDNTREVVAGFYDQRVRYIESKERLSIGDNYQNALNNAMGEYLTFLSDDDAFVPVMLERVKKIIEAEKAEVITFRVCSYYHDEDITLNRKIVPNTLVISQFTGKVTKFDTARAIKLLYRLHGLHDAEQDDNFIVSFLANAVYHHSVFSRMKMIRSKLFATTPADLYVAAAVFFVTDWYYCLDEPLHVWSNWADNATASPHKKGNKLKEHYEKLLSGEKLRFTPLKFALPYNCDVNAILQAKYDFDNHNVETKIDWVQYYFSIYENLMYLKRMRLDISQELREFNEVLSKENKELKHQVNSKIKSFRFITKEFLRNIPFALYLSKSLFKRNSLDKRIIVSGNECKFDNVLECANFLAANFLNR
ncbi:MAG: glycosyltransferase family 2 protein [Pyrinomonadaceae bacterium]